MSRHPNYGQKCTLSPRLETDKYANGTKFFNFMNPKNRYTMADCESIKTRRVLEFMVPILYPKRPSRVSIH